MADANIITADLNLTEAVDYRSASSFKNACEQRRLAILTWTLRPSLPLRRAWWTGSRRVCALCICRGGPRSSPPLQRCRPRQLRLREGGQVKETTREKEPHVTLHECLYSISLTGAESCDNLRKLWTCLPATFLYTPFLLHRHQISDKQEHSPNVTSHTCVTPISRRPGKPIPG